jgi:hypothetical protein
MSSFYDSMRKHEAEALRQQQFAASSEARAYQDAERAAHTVRDGFTELAHYLVQQQATAVIYEHFKQSTVSSVLSRYIASPRGFALYAFRSSSGVARTNSRVAKRNSRNLDTLLLLLPDGRLWRHQTARIISFDQGVVTIDANTLLNGFQVGLNSRAHVHDGQAAVAVGYDPPRYLSFTDYLGKTAAEIKSPTYLSTHLPNEVRIR